MNAEAIAYNTPPSFIQRCDGSVTRSHGESAVVLTVKTADCVPVFLFDRSGGASGREVGAEVAELFPAAVERRGGATYLHAAGIPEPNISTADVCTWERDDLCYTSRSLSCRTMAARRRSCVHRQQAGPCARWREQ